VTGAPPNKTSYFIVHLAQCDGHSRSVAQAAYRRRGPCTRGVWPPQQKILGIRHRRRRRAADGIPARPDGRHGHCCADTLFQHKEHLHEFATLRAIGSSSGYIIEVIIIQALLSAVIGFCLAAGIGLTVVWATAETALPVVMTPAMTLIVLLVTILMSVLSAALAIMKVMRIDPVMVFTR
jgi:hypothetical protein